MADLSYAHGGSESPLLGETIGVHFDRTVARWGDCPGLIVSQQGVRWTWRELGQRVDALAAGLLALGLEPGDRIGIWSPNTAEWIVTQFATAKAGLILVNINPAYRLAELEYALNKVSCRALVTATRFKTSDYVGMLNTLAPELARSRPGHLDSAKLPHLRIVIQTGEPAAPGTASRRLRAPLPSRMSAVSAVTRSALVYKISPARFSSMTRSISSLHPARPASRREPRSRTTTS
jgi:fatty-acyl-CoA synthase